MASADLRNWIEKVGSLGELKRIDDADWNLEIGCFVAPKITGNLTSAFLFDSIKGYPSGYRVLTP